MVSGEPEHHPHPRAEPCDQHILWVRVCLAASLCLLSRCIVMFAYHGLSAQDGNGFHHKLVVLVSRGDASMLLECLLESQKHTNPYECNSCHSLLSHPKHPHSSQLHIPPNPIFSENHHRTTMAITKYTKKEESSSLTLR
jgi:hypothetical protein